MKKPIYFISQTKREEYLSDVHAKIVQWADDWCFGSSKVQVTEGKSFELADELFVYSNDKNSIRIFLNGNWGDIIFSNLKEYFPKDETFADILFSSKQTFSESFNSILVSPLAQAEVCLSKNFGDKKNKSVENDAAYLNFIYHVKIGDFTVQVSVPSLLFLDLTKNSNDSSMLGIDKRNSLIDTGLVSGSVRIDFGNVSIADLSQLSKGDVITSSRGLDEKMNLFVNDRKIGSCVLGRNDKLRSIMMVGKNIGGK